MTPCPSSTISSSPAIPTTPRLAAAGAILSLKSQGRQGRRARSHRRRTDAARQPRNPPSANATPPRAILGLDWRGNLGLSNRSLVRRPRCPQIARRHDPPASATRAVDALLGRRPSRPRRRQRPGRCGAILGETVENRHARPAPLSGKDSLFSQHAPAAPPQAVVRSRRVGRIHERKMQAVACYHSQFIAGRPATPPTILDDIADRARYFGWLIGVRFGEPFLCREEVGLARSAATFMNFPTSSEIWANFSR